MLIISHQTGSTGLLGFFCFPQAFACTDHGGGIFDERKVAVTSYDFNTDRLQKNDDLVVIGEKEWGRDVKNLMKY